MTRLVTQAELGQRIRQARERIGMSQTAFAQLVSKDRKAISEYENGLRRVSAVELAGFAQALGVPITYFFEGEFSMDELDQVMLKEFRALLTSEDKQDVISIIRAFVSAIDRHAK